MKLLEKRFTANHEKMGEMEFLQIKKIETSTLNVYIYQRNRLDGSFFSYETFYALRRFKGQPLPGGQVEAESRERYPKGNSFGFTARESRSLVQAEIFLQEFVKELQKKEDKRNGVVDQDLLDLVKAKLNAPKGKRGRKRKDRPEIVYPKDQWFMKDLLVLNSGYSQPLAYQQLQKDIKSGLVVEVERIRLGSKGKPSVRYTTTVKK